MRAATAALRRTLNARERLPILAGLGATIALAWAYLLYMAWGMEHMDVGIDMLLMPRMTDWGAVDLALVFLMWTVMMVAMMLPSTLPMVMAFRSEPRHDTARSWAPRIVGFVAGYLMVWCGFSAAMTLIQWALLEVRWVSPMMDSRSPLFASLLLIAAGAFQFTPLKHACLSTCRSPLSFLMTEWRPGVRGAWIMGLRHGLFCTGCCWLLMALLFVLGVMNVAWIAVLTAFVLLEKTLPSARWVSAASGIVFIAWGAWLVRSAAQAA